MTQPAAPDGDALPPDDPLHPDAIARRRRRAEERAAAHGIKPLTSERLAEIGTGGPWSSDEEFEAYLAGIAARRRQGIA